MEPVIGTIVFYQKDTFVPIPVAPAIVTQTHDHDELTLTVFDSTNGTSYGVVRAPYGPHGEPNSWRYKVEIDKVLAVKNIVVE